MASRQPIAGGAAGLQRRSGGEMFGHGVGSLRARVGAPDGGKQNGKSTAYFDFPKDIVASRTAGRGDLGRRLGGAGAVMQPWRAARPWDRSSTARWFSGAIQRARWRAHSSFCSGRIEDGRSPPRWERRRRPRRPIWSRLRRRRCAPPVFEPRGARKPGERFDGLDEASRRIGRPTRNQIDPGRLERNCRHEAVAAKAQPYA
jgi:hypothetical protein